MINDLDKTLEELLKKDLPQELVSQVTISFDTPDDQFPPSSVTLPAIDLFLYDVRENLELRSNEWIVERHSNGMATRQRPPIRVECSYLITAWPSESAPNPAQDEHHLLGEVMRVLLRYPTIPAGVLQGSLKGMEPPLPTTSLQPSRLQSMGEFWQALGGKPKAALNYSVTIAIEPFEAIEEPVVVEKIIAIKPDVKR
ncbi:MAG: DUF4255 domain-containing protein [Proteobacteria bacterium]|nr:DUF4255 domain-containing protein [Pseudomonadota bacterium]